MHWSGGSLPGNSCRRRPGGPPADAGKPGPVAAKAAAIDAAQARPLTWKTVVKRALAVAMAAAAFYLVLPKLIAVLTVPGLIRGQQDRADAAADPFLPGSGTFGSSGPKPDASPQQAAESLPSSKVITMGPQSR
jgi:hypothetical protein